MRCSTRTTSIRLSKACAAGSTRRSWADRAWRLAVFSAATGGLLRGHRFGTRDRVARDRLVGGAQLSAARPGGRPARSFDDLTDAAPDRCRDAPRHLHVGATTTRPGGIAQGEDRGDRCHHARGERRDAQHRAARHRRELSGVSDRARHGLGDRDPDARGPGTGGQEAQEEDVEHGVDQPARPRCEGHEDERRPDASGPQSRACGRPGHRRHCRRHAAGRRPRRHDGSSKR